MTNDPFGHMQDNEEDEYGFETITNESKDPFIKVQPQNSANVYETAQRAITKLETDLAQLEEAYYGTTEKIEDSFILYGMDHLRRVVQLSLTQLDNEIQETTEYLDGGVVLNSSSSIENLCFAANRAGKQASQVTDSLVVARKMKNHVRQFMVHRLGPILDNFTETKAFVESYCQSFWDMSYKGQLLVPVLEEPDGDSEPEEGYRATLTEKRTERNLLDVLNTYERFRADTAEDIDHTLSDIKEKAIGFCRDGVQFEELCMSAQNLGERTRSQAAPFLLLFRHAIDGLQNSCVQLRNWLDTDKHYAGQLSNELNYVQYQRPRFVQYQRHAFDRAGHWNFEQSRIATVLNELRDLLLHNWERRKNVHLEYELAEQELKQLQVEAHEAQTLLAELSYQHRLKRTQEAREREAIKRERARYRWQLVKAKIKAKTIVQQFKGEIVKNSRPSVNERLFQKQRVKVRNDSHVTRLKQLRYVDDEHTTGATTRQVVGGGTMLAEQQLAGSSCSAQPDLRETNQRVKELIGFKIPTARHRTQEAAKKVNWFVEKDALLTQLNERREKCSHHYDVERKRAEYFERALERMDEAVAIIQHIRGLKTNPMTVQKLVRGVELKRLPDKLRAVPTVSSEGKQITRTPPTKEEKKLMAVIRFVAAHIGQDWRKLFYELPFEPARGLVELEEILERLEKRMIRADQATLRLSALTLWRHLNFAAKPQTLCAALCHINRKHLAELVSKKYGLNMFAEKKAATMIIHVEKSGNEVTNMGTDEAEETPLSPMTRAIQRYILPAGV